MPAKRKPERKADVLNAMAEYLLGAGVSEARLRSAAVATGTSARMLLYHFRSKEELMVAALREVRRRETDMLVEELAKRRDRPAADLMRRVWKWYASPRRMPYLQVFFEAWGMALRRPYLHKGFLQHVRKDLLEFAQAALVGRGYPAREARAVATVMIATFRGLLIDLVANPEDRDRLADAMELFILLTVNLADRGAGALQDTPAARPSASTRGRRGRPGGAVRSGRGPKPATTRRRR